MKRSSVSYLLALLVLTWEANAQPKSRLRVHVSDAYGTPVPADWIKIKGTSTTIDATQDEAVSLPYGQYVIEAQVRGFAITTVSAFVDQPDQVINIGMKLGKSEGETSAIVCSIVGEVVPNAGAVRIRAVQLFGSYTTDVPVSEGGTFQVHNLECGDYLLIAMGESKLLGTAMARAALLPTRVEVRIASK